jgi:hypothetical protein
MVPGAVVTEGALTAVTRSETLLAPQALRAPTVSTTRLPTKALRRRWDSGGRGGRVEVGHTIVLPWVDGDYPRWAPVLYWYLSPLSAQDLPNTKGQRSLL